MKVKSFKNLLSLLFGSSIILSSTIATCTTNVNTNNKSTVNKDTLPSSNKSFENNVNWNSVNNLSADASLFLENGSGVKGKLFYGVDENNNLTITGYDENFNASVANFKSQITIDNNSTYTLVAFAQFAFMTCLSLTEISIPSSVTSIGNYTFCGCTNLSSVEFETNSQLHTINLLTFANCLSLAKITIPSSVTSIGDGTFLNCINLKIVQFEQNSQLTEIEMNVFENCTSLTEITIPSSVTSIGNVAFAECTNLKSIQFESNSQLQTIKNGAFGYCSSLTEITMPSSVTSIGDSAFYLCTSLTKISVPSSITSIGHLAFGATSISNITLEEGNQTYNLVNLNKNGNGKILVTKDENPDNTDWSGTAPVVGGLAYGEVDYTQFSTVTTISNSCFQGSNINSVKISSNISSIGYDSFDNCLSLKSIEFESNSQLQTIDSAAFRGCTSLTEITISSSVTSISDGAFAECTNLKSIQFESNSQLQTIKNGAFTYCTSLTEITIPSSVNLIGNSAFSNCHISNIILEEGNSTYNLVNLNNNGKILVTKDANPDTTNWNGSSVAVGSLAYGDVDYAQYPSVTNIPDYAFAGTNINSVEISSNISSIGSFAFINCNGLLNIIFPSSVCEISYFCFLRCDNLSSVAFLWSTQEELENLNIANNWFNDDGYNGTIYVPTGTIPLYNQYAEKLNIENATIKEIPQPKEVNVALVTWLTLWVGLPTIAVIIAGIGYYNSIKKHKK